MSTNYEQFIAANQALIDCYKAVPADQYSAMSLKEQGDLCKPEADTVRQHFKAGNATFANILKERLAAMDKAE